MNNAFLFMSGYRLENIIIIIIIFIIIIIIVIIIYPPSIDWYNIHSSSYGPCRHVINLTIIDIVIDIISVAVVVIMIFIIVIIIIIIVSTSACGRVIS